jgi:hypothetical protein
VFHSATALSAYNWWACTITLRFPPSPSKSLDLLQTRNPAPPPRTRLGPSRPGLAAAGSRLAVSDQVWKTAVGLNGQLSQGGPGSFAPRAAGLLVPQDKLLLQREVGRGQARVAQGHTLPLRATVRGKGRPTSVQINRPTRA